MRKAVLFTVVEPKVKGESPKLYWKEENLFTPKREDAHIFTDREEMQKTQDMFPFDMQLEYLEV